ncbi:hypothetical protein [Streptomyces monashensis]|uniref:hypothetical protein n=1 Tax=Streptomyces monashensis TaxID=1678012 RepID=UPI0015A5BB4D|nr:hypothetical protein [Streptomyces monashensis]
MPPASLPPVDPAGREPLHAYGWSDTPGPRGVGMDDASDGLQQVFSEAEALAERGR